MNQLENLQFTEKDFDLITEGLEALPEKGAAGEIFGALLIHAFKKKDGDDDDSLEREMERKKRQKEAEKRMITEEVRLLQGKIIQLKRFLREQNLLKEVEDIIR